MRTYGTGILRIHKEREFGRLRCKFYFFNLYSHLRNIPFQVAQYDPQRLDDSARVRCWVS